MSVIDLRHATIVIRDGTTPTPNALEVRIGQGNLSYTEARGFDYRLNRGIIDTVRSTDDVPLDLSFDFIWDFLRSMSGAPPTIEEALKREGNASAWSSSSADQCEPYAVDLVVTYNPNCPGVDEEVTVFQDFRWESLDHSVKDGTVAVKGKCNIREAVITRVSAPAAVSGGSTAVAGIASGSATVTITPTGGVTPITYQFQRAPDASGAAGTYVNVGGPTSSNFVTMTGLTPSTTYWVRAQMTDSNYPTPGTATSTGTSFTAA